MTENMGAPPGQESACQTAAMQSISMSKPPFQAGTLMRSRQARLAEAGPAARAFDDTATAEEAAGVDLADRDLHGMRVRAGDRPVRARDRVGDCRLPAFGETVARYLDEVAGHAATTIRSRTRRSAARATSR